MCWFSPETRSLWINKGLDSATLNFDPPMKMMDDVTVVFWNCCSTFFACRWCSIRSHLFWEVQESTSEALGRSPPPQKKRTRIFAWLDRTNTYHDRPIIISIKHLAQWVWLRVWGCARTYHMHGWGQFHCEFVPRHNYCGINGVHQMGELHSVFPLRLLAGDVVLSTT